MHPKQHITGAILAMRRHHTNRILDSRGRNMMRPNWMVLAINSLIITWVSRNQINNWALRDS